jgi:hypothetical protein
MHWMSVKLPDNFQMRRAGFILSYTVRQTGGIGKDLGIVNLLIGKKIERS